MSGIYFKASLQRELQKKCVDDEKVAEKMEEGVEVNDACKHQH